MECLNIFLSYAREDERWRKILREHLDVFECEGTIQVWDDSDLVVGNEWNPDIDAALNRAQVAILVVTNDFLKSPFIRKQEVPRLLKRKEMGGLRIVPVIAETCPWDSVDWLSALTVANSNTKPLGSLRRRSQLQEEIQRIVRLILSPTESPGTEVALPDRINTVRRPQLNKPPIGRDDDLTEALTKLNDSQILLLYGAPGQGKTELARFIATTQAESYLDGIYEIDLQNERQIGNVGKYIGQVLGNANTGNPFELLGEKKVLILLDSFEGISGTTKPEDVRGFLNLLMQSLSGDSRVVITSREQFELSGVSSKQVGPLRHEDAIELFHRESNWQYRDGNTDELEEFVSINLGRHALSIKIVAGYSIAWKVDLHELVRLWKEKWGTVSRFSSALDVAALATSFELSYSSLNKQDRRFFLVASLFPDGIHGQLVRHIWQDSDTDVYQALHTLEKRSLLEGAEFSWKMLGPIMQFAREKRKLVERGPSNVLQRQLESDTQGVDRYYDAFVVDNAPQETDQDPSRKNGLIRNHFHNIHASLDRRLDPSKRPTTLSAAYTVLRLYWAYHNNLSGYKNAISSAEDAVLYLDKARHIFQIHNRNKDAIQCSFYIGTIKWLRGESGSAKPYLQETIDSEHATIEMRCDSLRAFAHMEYTSGNLARSAALYEQVMEEADKAQYGECRTKCMLGLIDVYRKTDEYEKGITIFQELQTQFEALPRNVKGNLIRGYAYILWLSDDVHEAESRYREALDIFTGVSPFGQAHCRRGLGDVYVSTGQLDKAEQEFSAAVRLYDEARKNPSLGIGLVEMGRGRLAIAKADFELAKSHFQNAIDLFDRPKLNEPFELGQAYEAMAGILSHTARTEDAIGYYQLASAQYQKTGSLKAAQRVSLISDQLSSVLAIGS